VSIEREDESGVQNGEWMVFNKTKATVCASLITYQKFLKFIID